MFTAFANEQNGHIKIKIAPFKTEILKTKVDNLNVQFPLIVYRDITYFPMTHDLCAMLRLASGFDSEKGLFISKYSYFSGSSESKPFGEHVRNSYKAEYDAFIPEYPIYLNGIKIDNTKEDFPLINFRGVTYFPMTWRFAYEELNFDIEWSEENYSFKLLRGDKSLTPGPYYADKDNMFLHEKESVYDPYIDEEGNVTGGTLLYTYWKNYIFDTNSEAVTRIEDTQSGHKTELDRSYGRLQGEKLSLKVIDKNIYYGDELLIKIEREVELIDPSAMEYKVGDCSIIHLHVFLAQSKAPYTPFNDYFLVRDEKGVRHLDWDIRNNFNGVFKDNNGGYYICSSAYSPNYMARWSNSFADIYYYTPGEDKLVSMAEKYSDIINSMQAIGVSGDKLYVKAMWYAADKSTSNSTNDAYISTVNSGYYTIDLKSGKFEKLYPYAEGYTYIAPNGNVYLFSDYARKPRIINLVTGNIIEF